jgi:glycosyltransferase involved in cell wall biosynthesis
MPVNAALTLDFLERRGDIAVLDDLFPHPLSAFRFEEIRSYLDEFSQLKVFTTGRSLKSVPGQPGLDEVVAAHIRDYPNHDGRILPSEFGSIADAHACYTVFLANAALFLDEIQRLKKPFAFTIYPGGGFAVDEPESDASMARVFGSPCFRNVIVTQPMIRDYLLGKGLCPAERLTYIRDGVIPRSAFDPPLPKRRYGLDKRELDICFVANRYMPNGADKGYDLLIETAKALCGAGVPANFHIVGGFDETVIDLGSIADRFRFYGLRPREFFAQFYQGMDLILSPNRPFVLGHGKFDGFPTGSCVEAGLQAVAVVCSDELRLNPGFRRGEEIVIVRPQVGDIVAHVRELERNPECLAAIGERGRAALADFFGREAQITPRIEVLKALLRG